MRLKLGTVSISLLDVVAEAVDLVLQLMVYFEEVISFPRRVMCPVFPIYGVVKVIMVLDYLLTG